jgi:hypothetical protein
MNEMLLKTIIEKLEALELAWKASGGGENESLVQVKNELYLLRQDLQNLPSRIVAGSSRLAELFESIENLQAALHAPKQSRVEHKHVLHKGIIISGVLFLLVVGLSVSLFNAYKSRKKYAANDIKYRYLKLIGTKNHLRLCSNTDSLYQKDPVFFTNEVESEEQRLIQQAEDLRLALEKEKEAEVLNKRASK